MPVDAYRDGDQLIVQFDLPCRPRLALNVENNVLTTKAKRPRQQIQDSQWLASERLHGTFSGQLHLSDGLHLDKIHVSYDHGVLTISFPVAEEAKDRRIEVGRTQIDGADSVASRPNPRRDAQPRAADGRSVNPEAKDFWGHCCG